MHTRTMAVLSAAAALYAGCAASSPILSAPGIHTVDDVIRANPIGDEPVGAVEVQRGPRFSLHVVQVADRIGMHRHYHSDETIWLWRGAGTMHIGSKSYPIQAGMVVHVPRGVSHGFQLTSSEPAAGVSMFTPPLRERDRVPVER